MALASDGAMQAQSAGAASQFWSPFCQEVDFFDAGPDNQGSIVLESILIPTICWSLASLPSLSS